MADIFVSYARADRARVAPLVAGLEAQGWSVWWDPNITPGQEFDALISDEINKARAVVVVWTSVSVHSRWVRGEARMAADRGVLVPVRFDATELPIDVRSIHTADFDDWGEDIQGRPFQDLMRALRALVPDEGRPPTHTLANIAGQGDALGPAERGRAKGRRGGFRLPLVAAAALLLMLAGAGLWLARDWLPWRSPGPVRIALMPFAANANDAALHQIADEVTDKTVEVLTANQIQTMPLRSAGGAGQGADGADATFVLSGSVRRDGETLRVAAQVEDAKDRVVLWSGETALRSAQYQALKVQAAARLARVLKCAAAARSGGLPPGDAETLSLSLRLCDANPALTDLGQTQAILDLGRQVVARAPRFSYAHSDLAYNSTFLSDFFPPGPREDLLRTAKAEADKALALDPRNADGWIVLSMLLPPDQWARREALLKRAVATGSNFANANAEYGDFLSAVGRLQDALVFRQKAFALAPLDSGSGAEAALSLARLGQAEAAEVALGRAESGWPDQVGVVGARFYLSRWEGHFDTALAMLQGDSELNRQLDVQEREAWRAVLTALNSGDHARKMAQRDSQIAFGRKNAIDLSFSIENLSQLGLVDDAFAQARALKGVKVPINSAFLFSPSTAAMRRDPRFIALVDTLGLVDYWRSTGKWPDFCAEPGPPYDCRAEAAKLAARPVG